MSRLGSCPRQRGRDGIEGHRPRRGPPGASRGSLCADVVAAPGGLGVTPKRMFAHPALAGSSGDGWCYRGAGVKMGGHVRLRRAGRNNAKSLSKPRPSCASSPTRLFRKTLQFYQQRNRYKAWAEKLGVPPLHGLRHCYAERRYAMLTGWSCPLQGGKTQAQLTPEEKSIDRAARQQISYELGHNRLHIVGMYIGR